MKLLTVAEAAAVMRMHPVTFRRLYTDTRKIAFSGGGRGTRILIQESNLQKLQLELEHDHLPQILTGNRSAGSHSMPAEGGPSQENTGLIQ